MAPRGRCRGAICAAKGRSRIHSPARHAHGRHSAGHVRERAHRRLPAHLAHQSDSWLISSAIAGRNSSSAGGTASRRTRARYAAQRTRRSRMSSLRPVTITTGHGAARTQSRATGPSGGRGLSTGPASMAPGRALPRTSSAAPAARSRSTRTGGPSASSSWASGRLSGPEPGLRRGPAQCRCRGLGTVNPHHDPRASGRPHRRQLRSGFVDQIHDHRHGGGGQGTLGPARAEFGPKPETPQPPGRPGWTNGPATGGQCPCPAAPGRVSLVTNTGRRWW
jgi:hypothetical protein